jgi:hypothetical protein
MTEDRGRELTRRMNELLAELDEMKAAGDGWLHRIDPERLADWQLRKAALIRDIERHQLDAAAATA